MTSVTGSHRKQMVVAALVAAACMSCGSGDGGPLEPEITSLVLERSSYVVGLGATTRIIGFGETAPGAVPTELSDVDWSSSNASVAAIDAGGNVTGLALGGPISITAASGGRTATATVTVTPASVTIAPGIASLVAGASVQLSATAFDAAGQPIDAGATAWSTGDATVATIDATGRLTALASGITTVIAAMAGKSADASFGVPSVHDGLWQDSVTGRKIQVDVLFGTATMFRLNIIHSCGLAMQFDVAVNLRIIDGQFSSAAVSGVITSPTTMSGSYGQLYAGVLECPNGTRPLTIVGPVSFTVTKQ